MKIFGGDLGVYFGGKYKKEKRHNGIGVSGHKTKNDDKATWEEGAAEEGDQELSYYFCKR